MKTVRLIFAMLVLTAMVTSCGYHNPNVYNGQPKTIYMTEWKNRTSELGLDSEIYRTLTKWFQQSGSIATVRKKEGADLIFAGEILSLELPSLAYGADSITTQVKVILRVRYILRDIATKKIVLEVPSESWTEEFLVSDSSSSNISNENEALDTIIDDMSKRIYQRTITKLRTLP